MVFSTFLTSVIFCVSHIMAFQVEDVMLLTRALIMVPASFNNTCYVAKSVYLDASVSTEALHSPSGP